jgi:peptide deformylase
MRLPIFQYGEPILRAKGKHVERVDERIRKLAANMLETMQAVNGVGLAAQQVGEAIQLTVLDVSPVEDRPSTLTFNGEHVDPKVKMPLVLINPQITLGAETEVGIEGCLSFPDITGEIERAESVIVHAETLENEKIEIEATGLLARAIQHEIDHLNGILFVDRMNSATKVSLASRLKRLQKETKRGRAKDRRVAVDQSAL